jgi:hypothetical protein
MENETPPFGEAFGIAWDEWLQYRKERKLPKYVPTGLKRTFSSIIKLSGNDEATAVRIIYQSIENNWQGLFELKQNGSSKTTEAKSKLGNKSGGFGILAEALKSAG